MIVNTNVPIRGWKMFYWLCYFYAVVKIVTIKTFTTIFEQKVINCFVNIYDVATMIARYIVLGYFTKKDVYNKFKNTFNI